MGIQWEPVLDKLFDKVEGKLFVVIHRDELRPEFFLLLATAAVVAMHEDGQSSAVEVHHQSLDVIPS